MTSNAAAHVVHVCNAAFFGIGVYVYLLEFGIHFSLVPPRFEQSVSAQITVLAEYAAAMGYVALLYWALPFFVAPFFMPCPKCTHEDDPEELKTPSCIDAPIYCASLILNDALLNRADGSRLVEGAIDRIKVLGTSGLIIFLQQVCIFAVIMFVVRFVSACKATRCTVSDVESGCSEKGEKHSMNA